MGNGVSITFNGWRNLFSIKELVYKELFVELFSTVSFEENTVDPQYVGTPIFRLGGQYQDCSLAKLAWRMGSYEQHEAMSPQFDVFCGRMHGTISRGSIIVGFGLQL